MLPPKPTREEHDNAYSNDGQDTGTGAVTTTSVFFTGWMKLTLREWRQIPPSALERGAPYFRSPLMTQPMFASWQRIW